MSNETSTDIQKKNILSIMQALGGKATLKQIEQKTGLPQSTVSRCLSDLRKDKEIIDTGDLIVYENRRRKLFAIVPPAKAPLARIQNPIFNYKKNLI